jgi:general secretion pathway protein D
VNVLGGLIEHSQTKALSGLPGIAQLPFFRYFASDNTASSADSEVLIVVIPHIIRLPSITAENLASLASGTDTNPAIRLDTEVLTPAVVVPLPGAVAPAASGAAAPVTPVAPAAPAAPQNQSAQLGFAPDSLSLKPGETSTIGIVVQNVQDLYSMPLLLQYDPKVISVEDVRQGGFLSGGTQPIAVVNRVDQEHGQAVVSASRMPNTPGISGSGTVFGVVVRGVAAGSSKLSIVQVNARDSQQRPLSLVTSEATIQVQP